MAMEDTGVLGYVKSVVDSYPDLKEFEGAFPKVDIEELSENATCYSIEPTPCKPILKEYLGGRSKRQFQFIFSSREVSVGNEKKLENNKFYEGLDKWFRDESRNGRLPKMPGGKEVIKIEAMTGGYVYDQTETKSQYQIQCRLVYMSD